MIALQQESVVYTSKQKHDAIKGSKAHQGPEAHLRKFYALACIFTLLVARCSSLARWSLGMLSSVDVSSFALVQDAHSTSSELQCEELTAILLSACQCTLLPRPLFSIWSLVLPV